MNATVTHDMNEESPEAKVRWFKSLSLGERMELFCCFTDLIASKRAAGREVDREDIRLLELPAGDE